jgi:hypothetical protein
MELEGLLQYSLNYCESVLNEVSSVLAWARDSDLHE